MSVVIETTIGDITVDLYVKERPNTCLNFLKLCKVKFYNLCVFYKIEKNFIAQTGDPTATGRGGESIFCRLYGDQAKYFDGEYKPRLKHGKLGTLSMVNNGNNMNGSQFFLTLSENLTYLDENHSVFGEVAEGFDILLKINDAICDNNNRPYQDIRITHTVILHDPFEDPKGLEIPDASPEPTKEMLESNYIGADEEIDDTKGKTAEEVEEKIKESEAKARATILEMVGDIPDADVKPPENVLFVCKLNPVTTSEDLEIIFSRFGKIMSCEVIKDKKTGESLQYAFIEFEREEDCEAAYFKMDNVLIDDRRIHVDFSQSVSKLNFDRGNSTNTKQIKRNFSLKIPDRNDGYDLIFDDSNDDENKSHKSKLNESSSKHKSSSQKKKHTLANDDHGERRKINKEHGHSDRRYNDLKKYRYSSENKSYRYREEQRESRKDSCSYSSNRREFEKSVSFRFKENYSYTDKNEEYRQNQSKKYEDEKYLSSRKRDYDYKPKSKYSTNSLSRNDRDSGYHRKSPPELYSKEHKSSRKRSRNDSESPDQSKKACKGREQTHECSNKKKYSDRLDLEKHVIMKEKNKSHSSNVSKEKIKSSSQKQKKDKLTKYPSSKQLKSKTSRSSSVTSSSSSSTTTSSSSSSSSSSSISDSSESSNSKHRRKHHYKKYDSKNKTKSSKRNKQ